MCGDALAKMARVRSASRCLERNGLGVLIGLRMFVSEMQRSWLVPVAVVPVMVSVRLIASVANRFRRRASGSAGTVQF